MSDNRHSHRVLIVDDEPANTDLLAGYLRRWGYDDVATTNTSRLAIQFLESFAPDIVLLDLNMPPPPGFDLRALFPRKADGVEVPVLILTADVSRESERHGLEPGAHDFLTKPFDPAEVRLRVANLLRTRHLELDLLGYGQSLERRVLERTRELDAARREMLASLTLAAEFRDDSSGQHPYRVGHTTALLATQLGAPPEEVELLRQAAPLHDLGKIGIPDAILLKPARFEPDEFEQMKQHAQLGAHILGGSSSPVLAAAEEIALSHHEHWDGTGYPRGLAGTEIPWSGRLVTVADVFDALTHERPYKEAWPVPRAVAEIRAQNGMQFDPDVVDAFNQLDAEALTRDVPVDERAWPVTPSPAGR